jgi:hypothetical protein
MFDELTQAVPATTGDPSVPKEEKRGHAMLAYLLTLKRWFERTPTDLI